MCTFVDKGASTRSPFSVLCYAVLDCALLRLAMSFLVGVKNYRQRIIWYPFSERVAEAVPETLRWPSFPHADGVVLSPPTPTRSRCRHPAYKRMLWCGIEVDPEGVLSAMRESLAGREEDLETVRAECAQMDADMG